MVPPQHGTAEHGTGFGTYSNGGDGYIGITPPHSPRRTSIPGQRSMFSLPRSSSRRRNRDDSNDGGGRSGRSDRRSRERRAQREEDDTQLPTGWGARMLAAESKIRGLETALHHVKSVIEDTNNNTNINIDQLRGFVSEVDGRFGQLEIITRAPARNGQSTRWHFEHDK